MRWLLPAALLSVPRLLADAHRVVLEADGGANASHAAASGLFPCADCAPSPGSTCSWGGLCECREDCGADKCGEGEFGLRNAPDSCGGWLFSGRGAKCCRASQTSFWDAGPSACEAEYNLCGSEHFARLYRELMDNRTDVAMLSHFNYMYEAKFFEVPEADWKHFVSCGGHVEALEDQDGEPCWVHVGDILRHRLKVTPDFKVFFLMWSNGALDKVNRGVFDPMHKVVSGRGVTFVGFPEEPLKKFGTSRSLEFLTELPEYGTRVHVLLDTGRGLPDPSAGVPDEFQRKYPGAWKLSAVHKVAYSEHVKVAAFHKRGGGAWTAVVGGIDFVDYNWDEPSHPLFLNPSPRRLDRFSASPRQKWQDASVFVAGDAGRVVATLLAHRWLSWCAAEAERLLMHRRVVDEQGGWLGNMLGAVSAYDQKNEKMSPEAMRAHACASNPLRAAIDATGLSPESPAAERPDGAAAEGPTCQVRQSANWHNWGVGLTEAVAATGDSPSGSDNVVPEPGAIQQIHASYLDAIANAKRFVYIENQYVWSVPDCPPEMELVRCPINRVFSVLKDRLKKAIRDDERFSVVVVMPALESFSQAYQSLASFWCTTATCGFDGLAEFVRKELNEAGSRRPLSDFLTVNFLGVLQRKADDPPVEWHDNSSAWHGDGASIPMVFSIIYVHTKVLLTESFASIGSANLNDRSLSPTATTGDSEMNVDVMGEQFAESVLRKSVRVVAGDANVDRIVDLVIDGKRSLASLIAEVTERNRRKVEQIGIKLWDGVGNNALAGCARVELMTPRRFTVAPMPPFPEMVASRDANLEYMLGGATHILCPASAVERLEGHALPNPGDMFGSAKDWFDSAMAAGCPMAGQPTLPCVVTANERLREKGLLPRSRLPQEMRPFATVPLNILW